MRCVAFASVHDTRKVTSVYQMWRSGESSASLHEVDVWQATQRVLQDRMNLRPLVLPAGSTDRLAKMCERLAELDATRLQLEATRHEAASLRNEARRDQQIVAEASAAGGSVREDPQRIRRNDQLASLATAWPSREGYRNLAQPAQTSVAGAFDSWLKDTAFLAGCDNTTLH